MSQPIAGTKPLSHLHEEALRAQAGAVTGDYDADDFTIGVVTDQSLKNRVGSTLFVNVERAHHLLLYASADCSLRFGSASKPLLPIVGGTWVNLHFLEFADLLVTTSAGSTRIIALIG